MISQDKTPAFETAEVVVPCTNLDDTLVFFRERLGFRLESICPADDPSVAVINGHGVRLRLERGPECSPAVIRMRSRDPVVGGKQEWVAPNGTRVVIVDARRALPPLRPAFVVSRASDARWVTGRAGMRYRDLIPDRQGGRFIASHIRIAEGGPVPDYVHFHAIRLQMIYCRAGWARLVYEEQGEPFLLRAGDCVLQPPLIRHRVLECSPGLEVIELTCPAEHETHTDHELKLPTDTVRPERAFDGQRFVHHESASAAWDPWSVDGFEARDLGIAAATAGLARAHVARWKGGTQPAALRRHDGELQFTFVLAGAAELQCTGHGRHALSAGDAFVVPAGVQHGLAAIEGNFELLEVSLPASENHGV